MEGSQSTFINVVVRPFNFEGNHRRRQAESGLIELSQHVDTMIVVSFLIFSLLIIF